MVEKVMSYFYHLVLCKIEAALEKGNHLILAKLAYSSQSAYLRYEMIFRELTGSEIANLIDWETIQGGNYSKEDTN